MSASEPAPEVVKTFTRDGDDWVLEDRGGVHVEVNPETGFERVTHPEGFRAAFDLTRTWGRDVWRDLMEMFGLEFHELDITTSPTRDDPWTIFAWVGNDLVIRTSKNPLTGEKSNYHGEQDKERYTPENHHAKCGYIHLEGDEDAVKEAVDHIRNNSNYKEVSVGRWCV